MLNIRKVSYNSESMETLKAGGLHPTDDEYYSEDLGNQAPFIHRHWAKQMKKLHSPNATVHTKHNIGQYPLTSGLASWVADSFKNYQPSNDAKALAQRFSTQLHEFFENERAISTGFHNLNLLELVYQVTLEVGTEILIAASKESDNIQAHTPIHSRGSLDDHFASWGKLLTGIDCDPPAIAQIPYFLLLGQAFSLETYSARENYIYATLIAVDWMKCKNEESDRFKSFEKRVYESVPTLADQSSGKDRSFWRIAIAYISAMSKTEDIENLPTPRRSYIDTKMDPYLLMAMRAFDGIGFVYMCSDGATFLDNKGMDSLIGSALPNDVIDLHTDIKSAETRNLLRLLYPNTLTIDQSLKAMSTVLSGMLCEIFRGHKRAHLEGREDGRIAASSIPYSLCRARRRLIFETMELYMAKYPQFWDWVWRIHNDAKAQITEAGLNELLADALYRSKDQGPLPESPRNAFFDPFFEMIEGDGPQLQGGNPLNVHEDLGQVISELSRLWHDQLLDPGKEAGWGRAFDEKSDTLFGRAGDILHARGNIDDEVFRFAVAYGHLSMSLPYVAYHAIDAIILAYGIVS